MVATSLDIQGRQIEAGERNAPLLKQVVGDLARYKLVLVFHGSCHQTSHDLQKVNVVKIIMTRQIGVINDALGRAHSPASSDQNFQLEIILVMLDFELKSGYVHYLLCLILNSWN